MIRIIVSAGHKWFIIFRFVCFVLSFLFLIKSNRENPRPVLLCVSSLFFVKRWSVSPFLLVLGLGLVLIFSSFSISRLNLQESKITQLRTYRNIYLIPYPQPKRRTAQKKTIIIKPSPSTGNTTHDADFPHAIPSTTQTKNSPKIICI